MSEEPTSVDLLAKLRRSVEMFARGDFDGAAAVYAENGVLDMSPVGIGTFEGRVAISEVLADWFVPYEDYTLELEELRQLDNGVTFGVVLYVGRPAGSSRSVDVRHSYASVWTDGLIERTTGYADIDEARVAAEQLAEERG
jgi:hypothetical protein